MPIKTLCSYMSDDSFTFNIATGVSSIGYGVKAAL